MSHYAKLALPAPAAGSGGRGSLITPAVGRSAVGGGGGGGGGGSKATNLPTAHVAAFTLAAESIVDAALASTAQQVHRADASDDVIASASAILNKSTKVLTAVKTAQANIRAEAEKSAAVSLTIHTHIATVTRGESLLACVYRATSLLFLHQISHINFALTLTDQSLPLYPSLLLSNHPPPRSESGLREQTRSSRRRDCVGIKAL